MTSNEEGGALALLTRPDFCRPQDSPSASLACSVSTSRSLLVCPRLHRPYLPPASIMYSLGSAGCLASASCPPFGVPLAPCAFYLHLLTSVMMTNNNSVVLSLSLRSNDHVEEAILTRQPCYSSSVFSKVMLSLSLSNQSLLFS